MIKKLITTIMAVALTVVFMTMPIPVSDASEQKERLSLPSETSHRLALGITVRVDEPEQDGSSDDQSQIHCNDPRPEVCTREYRPVCARLQDGDFKTYSNGCTACSDPAVNAYFNGACEE